MLKKTLLSLAVAASAVSLVACNNAETVTEPVVETETAPEAVTDAPAVEETAVDPMAETDTMAEAVATQSITELAVGNADLSILVEALQAAGLDQTLAGDGQFTVFAPTNDAFAALLETLGMTKEALFSNTELLTSVLTYHVVPDAVVKAADIPYGSDIKTVNGAAFMISDTNMITAANGGTANITATDIMATNGVVHVIDSVLLPE